MVDVGRKVDELERCQTVLVDNVGVLKGVGEGLNGQLDEIEDMYILKLAEANAMVTNWATEAFKVREMGVVAAIRVLAYNFKEVSPIFEIYRHCIQRWRHVSHEETITMACSSRKGGLANGDRYTQLVQAAANTTWQQRVRAGANFLREMVWRLVLGDVRGRINDWQTRMLAGAVLLRTPEGTVRMTHAAYRLALTIFRKLPSQQGRIISGLLGNWRRAALLGTSVRRRSGTTGTR